MLVTGASRMRRRCLQKSTKRRASGVVVRRCVRALLRCRADSAAPPLLLHLRRSADSASRSRSQRPSSSGDYSLPSVVWRRYTAYEDGPHDANQKTHRVSD